ncbi:cell division protein FtsQ/DivIB [Clostridium guangxiense]|uniref:cell division protein FtsQ/DivIB n=1 Tax=Clostridium guangxiense TaxID=1662055 RepID=UPI001E363145|nr:FtsQ-type POTRA domain-containing protein [Clostridium guangxiense]MCD2345197.1 FtsQ-type POTRA domain-containing protein [Clostridium guangxiense]
MVNEKNELIEKRRKKIRRKKLILFSIILICVLVTLCLKLSYFNIKNVVVNNNYIISSNEIIKQSGIIKGVNIFTVSLKSYKGNIKQNPYIMDVNIHKEFPDTISITVKERKAVFYAQNQNKYIIIDKNGIILEKRDNLDGMKLIRLDGFNTSSSEIGKIIKCDDERKLKSISMLTDAVLQSSGLNLTTVDVSDGVNLKAYINNMCIILGSPEELSEKLNKAINIVLQQNLKDKKGYVDVSFNGNPVYCIQN